MTIAQVGLNAVDITAAFQLLAILGALILLGFTFGVLAIASAPNRSKRVRTLILASLAMGSTATLFLFTRDVSHGFNFGTMFALAPTLLGCWAIVDVIAPANPSSGKQYSIQTILKLIFCVSLAVALMAYFRTGSIRYQREVTANAFVAQAKMILATPSSETDTMASDILGFGPKKLIDLCTKAIKLAPDNSEAYSLRAVGYDRIGDSVQASADRLRAEELGYVDAAASDTEQ
jgi:hypothetical protein